MANAHVAHDCRMGNNVILTNNAMLAGHVDRRRSGVYFRRRRRAPILPRRRTGHGRRTGPHHQRRPPVCDHRRPEQLCRRAEPGRPAAGRLRCRDVVQLKEAYRLIYRSGLMWAEILRRLQEEFRRRAGRRLLSLPRRDHPRHPSRAPAASRRDDQVASRRGTPAAAACPSGIGRRAGECRRAGGVSLRGGLLTSARPRATMSYMNTLTIRIPDDAVGPAKDQQPPQRAVERPGARVASPLRGHRTLPGPSQTNAPIRQGARTVHRRGHLPAIS